MKFLYSELHSLLSRYRGSLLGKRGDKAFYKTKELAQFQLKYEALVNHILDEYSFEKAPKWIHAAAFYPDIETLRVMKCETYSQRKIKFKEEERIQGKVIFDPDRFQKKLDEQLEFRNQILQKKP